MELARAKANPGSTAVGFSLAAVVGIFVGGVTSFTHRQWPVELGATPLPLGLPLGVLVVAAVLIGMRFAFGSRTVTLGGGVGVLTALVVLSGRGPGGTVVIVRDWVGWTWVVVSVLLVVTALAIPATGGEAQRRANRIDQ